MLKVQESHHAVRGPGSPGEGLALLRCQSSGGFKATATFQSAQKDQHFNNAISIPVHRGPVVGQANPAVTGNHF